MTYSPPLASTLSNTRLRTPSHRSPFSGMCAACSADCPGTCEITLSAVRGTEALLPYLADINQFASEKDYPVDFSHLAINGRAFGAQGCPAEPGEATFPKADITAAFGLKHPVPLTAPLLLPAMAKLNWQDYFSGAALAGVPVVIGEDVILKDKGLVLEKGRVAEAPLLEAMVKAFRAYDRGFGDVVVQANADDDRLGVLDYALTRLGVRSVELKFGQAAKGFQGYGKVGSLANALRLVGMGYVVHPDPRDPEVAARYEKSQGPEFERIGQLPLWDEAQLEERVRALRSLGAQRICFKTGPFDPRDLVRILRIASRNGVDLVTLDGAGGGTGNSPLKMMNEWGLPTVALEGMTAAILREMAAKGYALPQVAMAGGFVTEDQVFKGLALGAPHIGLIAVGRGAMAAAMSAKNVGEAIKSGNAPKEYARFGNTIEAVFTHYRELKGLYGAGAAEISPGAAGVYSYLRRVSVGLRQLMALNRKFVVSAVSREDIYALTEAAACTTGLPTVSGLLQRALQEL